MEARLNISRYRVDDLVAQKVLGPYVLVHASCSRKDSNATSTQSHIELFFKIRFLPSFARRAVTAAKRQKGCIPTKFALKPFGPADGGADTVALISSFF